MTVVTIFALALSAAIIALLCRGDPKRRRSARLAGEGMSAIARRSLSALACLPGVALAATGDSAAFLIWLGGCAVIGWFVALSFQAGQDIG